MGDEAQGAFNRHTGYWRWFEKPQYCRFIRIYPLKIGGSHEAMRIALSMATDEKWNINQKIGQTDAIFKLNGPGDKINVYRNPPSLPGNKVIVRGNGSRTYEWMMKVDETANRFMRIFTVGPGPTVNQQFFACIYPHYGYIGMGLYSNDWHGHGYGQYNNNKQYKITYGANARWHHCAITWNGHWWKFYQDGVMVNQKHYTHFGRRWRPNTQGNIVNIGDAIGGPDSIRNHERFKGEIKHIRFYNTWLSASTIREKSKFAFSMNNSLSGAIGENPPYEIRERTIHFGNGIKKIVGYDQAWDKTWTNVAYIDGNDRYTHTRLHTGRADINLDTIYFVNPSTNEKIVSERTIDQTIIPDMGNIREQLVLQNSDKKGDMEVVSVEVGDDDEDEFIKERHILVENDTITLEDGEILHDAWYGERNKIKDDFSFEDDSEWVTIGNYNQTCLSRNQIRR